VNNPFSRAFTQTIFLFYVLCVSIQATSAQSNPPLPQSSPTSVDNSKQDPRDPVERSDEFKSKLTFGVYFTRDGQAYDLNLRRQFGQHVTAWIAGYHDTNGNQLIRIGAQYDYRKGWFHFVPTGEIETTRGTSLGLSSELGRQTVAIIGYSRTNLKTFFDLFWDPGDSVQLGVGHRISSYDRIQAYTIFDVRLHTGQQNTHVLWRHKLNRNNGITLDSVFKSGHLDSGEYIRAFGIGVYYDREKWFWKLYYDPHVNFAEQTMVRTGIGLKF
jgi:hypothetical protein